MFNQSQKINPSDKEDGNGSYKDNVKIGDYKR